MNYKDTDDSSGSITNSAGNDEIGGLEWSAWALANESKFRFTFAGKSLDITVPIYNVLQSATVAVRDGTTPVIMEGDSLVYRLPEDMDAFLKKIIVSATYAKRSDANATSVRADVSQDIIDGTLRPAVPPATGSSAPDVPTLRSTNVVYLGREGTDSTVDAKKASDDGTSQATASILTAATSAAYPGKVQVARLQFKGFSGTGAVTTRNPGTVEVGPIGYSHVATTVTW